MLFGELLEDPHPHARISSFSTNFLKYPYTDFGVFLSVYTKKHVLGGRHLPQWEDEHTHVSVLCSVVCLLNPASCHGRPGGRLERLRSRSSFHQWEPGTALLAPCWATVGICELAEGSPLHHSNK